MEGQGKVIWVASIVLGIIIVGLVTLGFVGFRVPKSLAIPSTISGFFLTLGVYLIWLARSGLLTQKELEPALGFGGGMICIGLFILIIAAACFSAGTRKPADRGQREESET